MLQGRAGTDEPVTRLRRNRGQQTKGARRRAMAYASPTRAQVHGLDNTATGANRASVQFHAMEQTSGLVHVPICAISP